MLGLAFQLLTVRLLPISEYIIFTTAIAVALLLQWLLGLGLPRLIARYGGAYIASDDSKKLWAFLSRIALTRLLVLAAVGTLTALIAYAFRDSWQAKFSAAIFIATIGWSASLILVADAEAVGQLLMQQRLARLVAWSEPAARILGLLILAEMWMPLSATIVVFWAATTSAIAAIALSWGVLRWHRGPHPIRPVEDIEPPPQRIWDQFQLSSWHSLVRAVP